MDSGVKDIKCQNSQAASAKSASQVTVEIIEYVPNSVVSKVMVRKASGDITVSSFDAGEELAAQMYPYDYYIQIIDGAAELSIKGKTYQLQLGEGIVVPAHSIHMFSANEQFKMICTIIKRE